MIDLIQVNTADLTGAALDWMVAQVEAVPVAIAAPHYGTDWRVYKPDFGGKYSPSTDWAIGGPLIQKYKVLLTPPTDMVHRNFGSFDKRNGWYESGHWGSTIFGKERKHRRTAFHHPDSPLIVAMRAIVQFELGDSAQVPKELLP